MPDPRPIAGPGRRIDRRSVPRHVAIVMDGNGRWAQRRGLAAHRGPRRGRGGRCVDTTYGALALGVDALTVYAFSTENWRRPVDEVRYLMNFNAACSTAGRTSCTTEGVRIVFSGRRDWRVPRGVLRQMDDAEALTRATER